MRRSSCSESGESRGEIYAKLLKSQIGIPKIGCEVGIWRGRFSVPLLHFFPRMRLLMVDRYLPYNAGGRGPISRKAKDQKLLFEAMLNAINKTMFATDRRVVMVGESSVVAELVGDCTLDFVFIDAGHDAKSVRRDIKSWHPKVRPGGIISGHDYKGIYHGEQGVKRIVDGYVKRFGYALSVIEDQEVWWTRKIENER